jgi:RES domain-containing protein
VIVWRLCKRRHSVLPAILDGEGARAAGGRWNRVGVPMVYASSSTSLGLLEQLVHADGDGLPTTLVAVRITVPEDAAGERIDAAMDLPNNWRDVDNSECIALGSDWVGRRTSLVLDVPSAINPLERNFLLNPTHADIARCLADAPIAIEYDPRLIALVNP